MNANYSNTPVHSFVTFKKEDKQVDLSEQGVTKLLLLFGLNMDAVSAFHYSHCAFNLVHHPSMQLLYSSNGYEQLTGFANMELNQENMLLFLSRIHPDDLPIINKIMALGHELIQQTDPCLLPKCKMSYNFRFLHNDGGITMFMNTVHHIFKEGQSQIHYSLTLSQDITHLKKDPSVLFEFCLFDQGNNKYHLIHREEFRQASMFTDREVEIIRKSSIGEANKQIADRLHISEQTVKNHKYSMFKKAGVKNMVELMVMAKDRGWV